jgi:hypothetical protein
MSMVIVVLIMMFLLALGLAVVWYASLQMGAARNLNSRQAALNSAYAGVQHARGILAPTGTVWSDCLTGHSNARDDGATTANPDPNKRGRILYKGCPSPATSVGTSCTGMTDGGVGNGPLMDCPYSVPGGDAGVVLAGYYTVWVRNDPGETMAAVPGPLVDQNGAVVVRVEGRDPAQTASVVVEAAVSRGFSPSADRNTSAAGKDKDQWNSSAGTGKVDWSLAGGT